MESKHIYGHRDAMAILNLLGFGSIPGCRDMHIRFRLCGNVFDLLCYDEQICLGILIPIESAYDYYSVNHAMEGITDDDTRIQCFLSEDICKVRICLPCHKEDDYSPAVSIGIKRLLAICEKLGEEMLGCVYEDMKPIFEEALAGKGNDVDN